MFRKRPTRNTATTRSYVPPRPGDEHRSPLHNGVGGGWALGAPPQSGRASLGHSGAPGVVPREQARARGAGQVFSPRCGG